MLDPYAPHQSLPSTLPASAAPQAVASYFPDSNRGVPVNASQHPARVQSQQQAIAYQGFDPDDMEFDMDQSASAPSSGAPSPPDTPISTPGYPSPTSYSAVPSPHGSQPASPISAFDTTTVLPSRAHHSAALGGFRSSVGAGAAGPAVRAEDAFNAYGGYSDYSSFLPGIVPETGANTMFMQQQGMSLGG